MSNILISTPPTSLGTGLLQLNGGVAMSSTLTSVTDQNNTASVLNLSTGNVGINTTSTFARLTIANNNTSTSEYLMLASTSTASFYIRNDGYLYNAEKGRISNILIAQQGTNSLSSTLSGASGGCIWLGTNGTAITTTTSLTPTAMLHVKGSGSTSATTSFLVQNSSGIPAISITDNGKTYIGDSTNTQPSIATFSGEIIVRGYTSSGYIIQMPEANNSSISYLNGTDALYLTSGKSNLIFQTNGANERMRITSTGNVGIGTTTPFRLLDVNGDASINTVRVGLGAGNVSSNTVLGTSALNANTTGSNNAGMGIFALAGNLTGSNNTAIGSNALRNNTNSDNTAVGYRALLTNTSGSQNTSVGTQSSYSNLTGVNNVSVGNNTLFTNSTGSGNTAIGASALFNQTGSSLTAVGYEALFTNVSGTRNTAIGNQALRSNTASNNTALGNQALYSNTTGGTNTAIGDTALRSNTNGEQNTALGYTALYTNVSGTENVGIGYQALFNSEASRNVAIGTNALLANTTGERNTAVGYSTSSGNFSNSVILGYGATATGSNQFVVGSVASNAGSVVLGANASTQYWNVKINGVDYKILLA